VAVRLARDLLRTCGALEEMVLHDGSDDAKTEQLHHLLRGPLSDFEGDESGVDVQHNLHANVGDVVRVVRDQHDAVMWLEVERSQDNQNRGA
jgi:hypothetical protein